MNTPNTAHWDDPEDREPPRAPPAAEIGATSPNFSLRTPHVFPYLFPIGNQTLISYDSSLNAETLAMVLSATISTGGILPLFGQATPLPVVLCHQVAKGDAKADIQALWDALADQAGNTAGFDNVDIWDVDRLNEAAIDGRPQLLNVQETRERFQASISARTVIVIYDLKVWMGESAGDGAYKEILGWFDDLYKNGHTVVVFEADFNLGTPSLKNVSPFSTDVITAVWDPEAPHQLGGGFTLNRKRKGYFDSGPMMFQYWYKVVEDQFAWGLEMREVGNSFSQKQHEILQRRIAVALLVKNKKSQKEIAEHLEMDISTISRDMSALRREKSL